MTEAFDLIVIGAGSAGMPAAIFAARRGAKVLLVESAQVIGGTLWVATGQMSAAGTALQAERGITDSSEEHYDDVMRISRGTANPGLVRLAVENAAATFDWLVAQGFAPLPEHPVTGFGHEPYRVPRYYWGAEGGITVKDVLVPLVMAEVAAGRIALRLGEDAVELSQDAAGAINGVVTRDSDDAFHRFSGRAVVLTTGGYAGDPELFERLNGYPQYSAAPYPFARGAGLKLGESAGGYARGVENIYTNFGTLFDTDARPAKSIGRMEHFPERRQPWEIYVNALGARFVREDVASVDAREMALMDQPGLRYWVVFDAMMLEAAPPIVTGWSSADLRARFDTDSPVFVRADSIRDLANAAGIDAEGLVRTVAAFNYGVSTGNDFLGRQHHPVPIATGPFYAIRMQGCSISSAIGLAVDDALRVIRRDGTAITGLYAAGEILGGSQTMGKASCGGMMVTPAMTFGRLLGERLDLIGLDK